MTSIVWVVPFPEHDEWVVSVIAACTSVPSTRAVIAVDDDPDPQEAAKLKRWFPHLEVVATPGAFGMERCWVEGAAAALTHRHTHTVLLYPGCRVDPGEWPDNAVPHGLTEPVVSRSFRSKHWVCLPVAWTRRFVSTWELPDLVRVPASWSTADRGVVPSWWRKVPPGSPPPAAEVPVVRRVPAHRRPDPDES